MSLLASVVHSNLHTRMRSDRSSSSPSFEPSPSASLLPRSLASVILVNLPTEMRSMRDPIGLVLVLYPNLRLCPHYVQVSSLQWFLWIHLQEMSSDRSSSNPSFEPLLSSSLLPSLLSLVVLVNLPTEMSSAILLNLPTERMSNKRWVAIGLALVLHPNLCLCLHHFKASILHWVFRIYLQEMSSERSDRSSSLSEPVLLFSSLKCLPTETRFDRPSSFHPNLCLCLHYSKSLSFIGSLESVYGDDVR